MADQIGSALNRLNQPATPNDKPNEIRNDVRARVTHPDGSSNYADNIADKIIVSNRPAPLTVAEQEADIASDPRVQSLAGGVDIALELEGLLDEAAEIIEDLRAAISVGEQTGAASLQEEFTQVVGNFTTVLQDGGRAGNNLLTSAISRLQVEVSSEGAQENQIFVIEGKNILNNVEEGGIFETTLFDARGDFATQELTQLFGTADPLQLSELTDGNLAYLQSVLNNAQGALTEFRDELSQNLESLQRLLHTARFIQNTDTHAEAAVINEERANLLALQTRQQLENIGGAVVDNSQENILQFFR